MPLALCFPFGFPFRPALGFQVLKPLRFQFADALCFHLRKLGSPFRLPFRTALGFVLAAGEPAFGFDRINTLWFVTALLRLRLGAPLLMMVLADRPFHTVPKAPEAANLIPLELHPRQLQLERSRPLISKDLDWIRDNLLAASTLMKVPTFNRVLRTLDSVVRVTNPGSAILIAWAAIEALLRPGRNQITERVCKALAAYLYEPGPERDRAYPKIVASYEARGGAAHAGDPPEAEQLQYAFSLARAAVSRAIEQKALPEVDALLVEWARRL